MIADVVSRIEQGLRSVVSKVTGEGGIVGGVVARVTSSPTMMTMTTAIAAAYAVSFVFGDLPHYWTLLRRCPPSARWMPVDPNYLPFGIDKFLWNIARFVLHLDRPFENMFKDIARHGEVVSGRGMLGPWGCFSANPDDIHYVLAKHFDNFEKGPYLQWIFTEFLGTGIFNVNGAEWRAHRNMARPQFEKLNLSSMTAKFWSHLAALDRHLAPAAAAAATATAAGGGGTEGPLVNMQDLFFRFTLDSVGEILFGTSVDSLSSTSAFVVAFDKIQSLVILKDITYPVSLFYLPREFRDSIAILNDFCDRMVRECLADPSLPDRTDLLAEYVNSVDEKGEKLSPEYLRDMLKNMLIAGRDTTAVLLTWTLYELAVAPHVVAEMKAEMDAVLGTTVDEHTPPTQDQLAELKYTKQVLNEVLRLHPSVPTDTRTCVQDDVLPSGHFIPAGLDITYPIYVVNRLPRYWGADAEQFDPARWSPERLRTVPSILHSLFFNSGPRICLGQPMAYAEAKSVLVYLFHVKNYTFSIPDRDNIRPFSAIILSAIGGLPCRVSVNNNKPQ